MIQVWTNSDVYGPVDDHLYDISVKDDGTKTYDMCRSSSTSWTNPGERVCTLTDDGNGVVLEIGDQVMDLDYSDYELLLAILLAAHEGKMELRETKTIKSI